MTLTLTDAILEIKSDFVLRYICKGFGKEDFITELQSLMLKMNVMFPIRCG